MSAWRIAGRTASKLDGEYDRANQDAWRMSKKPPVRVAVADGATQSYQGGSWARMLVGAFVDGVLRPSMPTDDLINEVGRLAANWKTWHVVPPDAPWHQEARALRGGAATIVGLEIRRRGRSWLWTALGVGDANLLVVAKDGHVRRSFPLRADTFESRPLLVFTRETRNQLLRGVRLRARGKYHRGDTFLLASDAVAWWLLDASAQAGLDVRSIWAALRSRRAFEAFVTQLREDGVPDDDMTLVAVRRS